MAEIILENLTKTYPNGAIALADLNLHVRDGELLTVVGPSGCGKTTLLRIIAGLEQPTHGVVRIDGVNVNRVKPGERNIAMVFQDHSLYPHLTVRQNLAFGLKARRVASAQREPKVQAAAEALHITALLDRMPGQLSGGERQRAALAKALVLRPQCFLLDEPLSSLDPSLRCELREQIRILHRQIGITMIHVTHDQEEALSLGQRVAVIRPWQDEESDGGTASGGIEQIDTPMQVYHKPVNRFVAGFIGSPRMNFINGRVIRYEGMLVFTNDHDIRFPIPQSALVLMQYHVDQPVVAGIRPGHLHDAASANDRCVPLWLRITHVEPMGGHTLVHTQTMTGSTIIAQLSEMNFRSIVHEYVPERHATLCVDPEYVQYFAADAHGRNLLHATEMHR